ncbi:ATP-binding protein [Streptomyces dangxiongensis]|uniref:ATP-binding protein n=1 Tax=Streptomyces dangxiongensis TaxID=1442032 RepID=UPI001F09BF05|nr:ATP-binding protein [Streptomyces dangxiongensis]
MAEEKWGRPAAGREPAAAALLAWLADADAPRLCLVTGSAGCGKSTLLAWLVGHGTRPGVRAERRVHGFVPLAGESVLTATWTLAQQLLVSARTPGELVSALAADKRPTVLVLPELHAADDPATVAELVLRLLESRHVRLIVELRGGGCPVHGLLAGRAAVMDLDEARWTDPERYALWAAAGGSAARPADAGTGTPLPPADLDDPAAVCAADPWQVTRLYERSGHDHGGLRTAWLRAGASLTRARDSAERALVLLAASGDDVDPRLPRRLADLAGGAAWQVVWRRVRGDVRPPWPGPAHALSAGRGELAGIVLVADHQGTVRLVDEKDAGPVGRLPRPVRRARTVAAGSDGTVFLLDGRTGAAAHPARSRHVESHGSLGAAGRRPHASRTPGPGRGDPAGAAGRGVGGRRGTARRGGRHGAGTRLPDGRER